MRLGTAAPDDLERLEDVSLVHAPAALRTRPLGDISQDDHLAVDLHPHLDRPQLVGPAAGAAAVGRHAGGHHRRPPLPRACLIPHGPVDQAASAAGKNRPGPGGQHRTALRAGMWR